MLIDNEGTLFLILIFYEAVSSILEKAESGNMSICKCEKVLSCDMENIFTFEIPPRFSNLGKGIAKEVILNGKKITFGNEYFFTFLLLPLLKKWNAIQLGPILTEHS